MIIYIHGFNSTGPSSVKYNELTMGLPNETIYCPTYPSNDPDEAIRHLSSVIEEKMKIHDEELMLVGTSLGGYYAQYLGRKYNAKVVLINPALNPMASLLKYVDKETMNFYSREKYTITDATINALTQYNVENYSHEYGTLVLLDAGDDIINYKDALMKYNDVGHVITYAGGNHRFAHMEQALPEIEGYYNSIWA